MKTFVLGIFFVVFMAFGVVAIKENSEREFALRGRINESVVLSCSHALGRGARGEVYRTTMYKLLDKNGVEWLYMPGYLQYEQLKCPTIKGD